jgi:uncharacterized protein YdhG (YjbR/CyaY superfamily)
LTSKSSSKNKKQGPKDVAAFLAAQPETFRRSLQALREAIQFVVPDAEEAFAYGIPGFKIDGKPLACYAGFKNHCGFYPMSAAVIRAYSSELKDYEVSEGTIRFHPEKMLSMTLIKKLVKARLAEIRTGSS